MSEYKAVCIDAGMGYTLRRGEIYTLTEAPGIPSMVSLKEKSAHELYWKDRFRKVEEMRTFKVRCIDNIGTGNNNGEFGIKVGKVYTAWESSSGSSYHLEEDPFHVINGAVWSKRFFERIVNEEETSGPIACHANEQLIVSLFNVLNVRFGECFLRGREIDGFTVYLEPKHIGSKHDVKLFAEGFLAGVP